MAAQYRGKFGFTVPGPGLVITGTLETSGSTPAASSTIVLTASTTLTGTINYGDTFTVSGQLYTCTQGATASGNLVTVPVSPVTPGIIATLTAATGYAVNAYAQDGIFLAPGDDGVGIGNTALLGVTACITSLVTGSTLELWLWDPSATTYKVPTSYVIGQTLLSAVGSTTVALASYPAALLRCKADGTNSGTTTVVYSAD